MTLKFLRVVVSTRLKALVVRKIFKLEEIHFKVAQTLHNKKRVGKHNGWRNFLILKVSIARDFIEEG